MAALGPVLGCLANMAQCLNNTFPCFEGGEGGPRWQCTCQNVANYARCCLACACCSTGTHVEGDRVGGNNVVTNEPTAAAHQLDTTTTSTVKQVSGQESSGLRQAIQGIWQKDT